MQSNTEMKPCPCPFCQSKKAKASKLGYGPASEYPKSFWQVECPCGAIGPKDVGKKAAIAMWNTRTKEEVTK